MIYPRRILDVVRRLIATWPVVILEGPRTVGKSTLLREIATASEVGIVDLDEPDIRHQVEADPQGYVTRARPVLIDEYPKIPRVIQHIKAQLNRDGSPGQFVLTGSASLEANKSDLGALVGRYADVLILPLAQVEIGGREGNFMEQAFGDIEALRSSGPSVTTRGSYIEKVLTGGFPLLVRSLDPADRYQRFTNYIDQSINYGMANLYEIREREYLQRLLYRYAAQTGQLLNIRGAARDVELKWGTAENYTRLLELIFLIHRLPAWRTTDRGPVSRPKIYVVDSGVGGRLLRLTTDRVTSGEPLFQQQYGHLLETFVLGEVRKMLSWMDGSSVIGYWRNRRGDEVDLVVERPDDDAVIGIEVKAGSRVTADDWRGMRMLRDEIRSRFRAGLVMYTGDMPYRLDDGIYAMPIDKLWEGAPRPTGRPQSAGRWIGEPMTSLLTADRDPLHHAVRSATRKMIDLMGIGEAAYWEVAILPPQDFNFGDASTADAARELQNLGWFIQDELQQPIDQCVAAGVRTDGIGTLIHRSGSVIAVVAGTARLFGETALAHKLVTDFSHQLVQFAYRILPIRLSPGSWVCWSAGRRLQSGMPPLRIVQRRLLTHLYGAAIDYPPHAEITFSGDLEHDASRLQESFQSWFSIPVG